MFKFLKKDQAKQDKTAETKKPWLSRLRSGLSKTRTAWNHTLANILFGKKRIDDELLEEIETLLLSADVGYQTTQTIINRLIQKLGREELKESSMLLEGLQSILVDILETVHEPLVIDTDSKPFLILMIGTNGSGKTTTIAKLSHQFKSQGLSILLAAGDTFRAAAIDQLETWGMRNNTPVISQEHGADSASVIFDALQSAQHKQIDVLLADTAGRLHTQHHLMEELKKIDRVIHKLKPAGPDETLLVIDASFGQNALQQAKYYEEAIGIDGIVLTKLDGTAKGGIIFSLANELKKPIRFIGVGESFDDLQPFEPKHFVEMLLEPIDKPS